MKHPALHGRPRRGARAAHQRPVSGGSGRHDRGLQVLRVRRSLARSLARPHPLLGYSLRGCSLCSTPWQPEFCNWAFNLPRGDKLLDKWRRIPSDTDVLITHTPPFGRGDQVGYMNVGCEDLMREVQERIKPTLHVFGHVHEGYGSSTDGVTTYFNASSCTHDYEPVNPPFVFDLDVPRSKTSIVRSDPDPVQTEATSESAGCECGVSDGVTLDYSRLLHEQLRVCSQKPVFVEKFVVSLEESEARKNSLRAFRVEGTTANLLFESTLRVRPVQDSQDRALRYLFSQGFKNNHTVESPPSSPPSHVAQPVITATTKDGPTRAVSDNKEVPDRPDESTEVGDTRRRRRQLAMARRVTVAVLNDLSESKEMTGPDREHLEQASVAAESLIDEAPCHNGSSDNAAESAPASSVRRRRDKTLRKRDGLTKLATLVEEPSANSIVDQTVVTAIKTTATTVVVSETVTEVPAPLPPAPVDENCVLCKYKVPGHVHPGREPPAPVVEAPPAPPAPERALSPPPSSSNGESADGTADSRGVSASSKRLSSWF